METSHPLPFTRRQKRTGELKRLIPNITQKMLTQQLRELEKSGVIVRKVYEQIPPKSSIH